MAEDEQERLRKLRELRRSGVLSDGEFQSARARMLAARERERDERSSDEPSILRSWWPAFAGVGILLLLVVGVVVYGRMMAAEEQGVDLNIAMAGDPAPTVFDAAQSGTELCASSATHTRVKDVIFDRAQRQYGGDPGPLDSLRQSVGVRMEYPLLRGLNEEIRRADCGGHIVLDLPPSVRAAFDGLAALESDLQYTVQPQAGENGHAVDITGADEIIRQLAVAASLVGGRGKAEDGAPLAKSYNPSFTCGGALANVERMICQDEQLSQLDRALAARYRSLRQVLGPSDMQFLSDSQRQFLRRRAGCTDAACLNDAYVGQLRLLEQISLEVEGERGL